MPQFEIFSSFEEWTEVLQAWFESNDITEDGEKREDFFTSLGSRGYHTPWSLVQPQKPIEKTYAQNIEILKNHYTPKPSEIVQRYIFLYLLPKSGAVNCTVC